MSNTIYDIVKDIDLFDLITAEHERYNFDLIANKRQQTSHGFVDTYRFRTRWIQGEHGQRVKQPLRKLIVRVGGWPSEISVSLTEDGKKIAEVRVADALEGIVLINESPLANLSDAFYHEVVFQAAFCVARRIESLRKEAARRKQVAA